MPVLLIKPQLKMMDHIYADENYDCDGIVQTILIPIALWWVWNNRLSRLVALNYNSEATLCTCEYLGCMDSLYFEYNPNATESNGSYSEIISCCLDSLANNYNQMQILMTVLVRSILAQSYFSYKSTRWIYRSASGPDIIIEYSLFRYNYYWICLSMIIMML